MKSSRSLLPAFLFVAFLCFGIRASAHVDAYLYFKDSTGKTTAVHIESNGTFQTPALHTGTYTLSFGLKRAISSGTREEENPKETITGIYSITVTPHIQPRDAASGLPTGRRMHKPLTITKEIDRTSPKLITSLGTVTIDIDGDGLAGSVVAKSKDGKTMAMDSWGK